MANVGHGTRAGDVRAALGAPSAGTRASESGAVGGALPGRLIVFEGPDGVGKSTVAAATAAVLSAERPCELLSFPGREPGTLGHLVYDVHHDSAGFGIASVTPAALQTLHIAAHLDAIERRIVPALHAGRDVVLDRFWWSTLVYGVVAGLDRALLATLIDVERRAWSAYRPYLAILLRRDHPIGRADEDRGRWMALREEYDALALAERDGHAVLVVEDAPDVTAARDQILAALRPPPSPTSEGHSGPARAEPGGNVPAAPPGAEDTARQAVPRAPSEGPAAPPNGQAAVRRRSRGGPAECAEQMAIPIAGGPDEAPVKRRTERAASPASMPASPVPAPAGVFVRHLAPAKITAVYETYWRFAAERQHVFFRRVDGAPAPWTEDPVLATYKFTNAYRAADRVSQYLIRHVIYRDDLPSAPHEVCFRVLLFKFFNKIETWQLLEREFGPVTWTDFRTANYDRVLAAAMARGRRIYSAAYIMPPGARAFGHAAKHRNHLALLERMMTDELPARLADARSMQQAFELLRGYPTIGDFLAYQFVTDINYSEVTPFSEMEFVVPGPGALSGIRKCFADTGGLNEPEIIRLVTDLQAEEFGRLGLEFRSLWGRPLQLIDCQNLFCEVDKYARVRHPDVAGRAGRTQIKQKFAPAGQEIEYWFPPKWQLNTRVNQDGVRRKRTAREPGVGSPDPADTLDLLSPARYGGPSA